MMCAVKILGLLGCKKDVDELEIQEHVQHQTTTIADNVPNAMFDANTFVNPFATLSSSDVESSSSQYVDPSNMHTFYQPYPHEFQWTKDHPLEQVIGEPSRTRMDAIRIFLAYAAHNIVHCVFNIGESRGMGNPVKTAFLHGTLKEECVSNGDQRPKLDLIKLGLQSMQHNNRSMIGAIIVSFDLVTVTLYMPTCLCALGTRCSDYAGCKTLQEYFRWSSILRRKLVSWSSKNKTVLRCPTAEAVNHCVSIRFLLCPSLWMRTQLTDLCFQFNKIQSTVIRKSALPYLQPGPTL
ncbi:hypothetical protein Tco_0223523 [Tanacetum coccineum]